jgi:hypothetical protein
LNGVLASAQDALKIRRPICFTGQKNRVYSFHDKRKYSLIENLPDSSFPENRLSLNTSASIVARELNRFRTPRRFPCMHFRITGNNNGHADTIRLYDNLIITGAD